MSAKNKKKAIAATFNGSSSPFHGFAKQIQLIVLCTALGKGL